MPSVIEAINVKRKMYFEFENAPYVCLDAEVSTPSARGAQTLVRLKMRNLLTRAVFDKAFKASDKFKEPEAVHAQHILIAVPQGADAAAKAAKKSAKKSAKRPAPKK